MKFGLWVEPERVALSVVGQNGLDESSLAIYRWNADRGDWDLVGGTVDPVEHAVTAMVDVLGLFTVGARMPSGSIALSDHLESQLDRTRPTIVTFTSGQIRMNTGEVVPDGTSFTVYSLQPDAAFFAPLGTINSADADPLTDGVQVLSHNGAFQFTVTYPPGVTNPRILGFATRGTAVVSQEFLLQ